MHIIVYFLTKITSNEYQIRIPYNYKNKNLLNKNTKH